MMRRFLVAGGYLDATVVESGYPAAAAAAVAEWRCWMRDQRDLSEKTVAARVRYAAGLLDSVTTDADVRLWDRRVLENFLDAGCRFARRLPSTVFDRQARRRLRDAGWLVADFPQSKGHRADFIVHKEPEWCRMTARVAAPPETVEVTRLRLADKAKSPEGPPLRVVVIPDHVDHVDHVLTEDGVRVVRLHDFLGEPPARAGN